MATATTTSENLKAGAVARLDKENASRGTHVDQYMICVSAKSSTGDSSKLDVGSAHRDRNLEGQKA